MADPITRQQLINASEDANDLGVFMNGDSTTDVSVRSGAIYPSLSKLLIQIGYNVPVAYTTGLVMSSPNQTVLYNGVVYAPIGSQIPFTTSGTFETSKFRVIQGILGSEAAKTVNSIAELKTVNKNVFAYVNTKGYYSAGDGAASSYYYDSADTTSVGNDFSVVVASDGGRWKLIPFGDVTAKQAGAKGDNSTIDSTALNLLLTSGYVADLQNLQYAVNTTVTISTPFKASGARIRHTANVTTAFDYKPGAVQMGTVIFDCSGITCQNGILLDGKYKGADVDAQSSQRIILLGKDHTSSSNGLILDARTGTANQSWVHYTRMNGVTVKNFFNGRICVADTAGGLTLSYVNANRFNQNVYIGCKRSIVNMGAGSSECSDNRETDFTIQFGAVAGSFPAVAITHIGNTKSNKSAGFIYDWEHINVKGPVIQFETGSSNNEVETSGFSWEVKDDGIDNRYNSNLTPFKGTTWHSPHGRGFLGAQDNVLAHWQPTVGTVVGGTPTSSGTAAVVLNGSSNILNLQRENHLSTQLDFTSGTGVAGYPVTFTSTTNACDKVSVVGVYFEKGFHADGIEVQINNGSGFISRAEISDNSSNEVFLKLDAVSGTNIYDGVLAIKVIFKGSDTRTVKIRQIFANGSLMKTSPSRGGDRIVGDYRWPNGVGPILVSPNGTEYRLTASDAGALVLVANPTKIMTFF